MKGLEVYAVEESGLEQVIPAEGRGLHREVAAGKIGVALKLRRALEAGLGPEGRVSRPLILVRGAANRLLWGKVVVQGAVSAGRVSKYAVLTHIWSGEEGTERTRIWVICRIDIDEVSDFLVEGGFGDLRVSVSPSSVFVEFNRTVPGIPSEEQVRLLIGVEEMVFQKMLEKAVGRLRKWWPGAAALLSEPRSLTARKIEVLLGLLGYTTRYQNGLEDAVLAAAALKYGLYVRSGRNVPLRREAFGELLLYSMLTGNAVPLEAGLHVEGHLIPYPDESVRKTVESLRRMAVMLGWRSRVELGWGSETANH